MLPAGVRVGVVSRCSWTLYNFRRGLLHHIVAAGAEAVAFGACDDGFDRPLRDEGIDIRDVPVSRSGVDPVRDVRLLASLVREFRRLRPDIVHSFTIKPAIYATLAAAIARVPVRIVTITGLGHAFTSAARPLRAIVSFLYRTALARADIVFFQNRDDRELFVARGLVDQRATRLIAGSGIDLEHYRPAPLPSHSGTAIRFVMVARLLKEKGVAEYISAARRLKEKYPAAQFRLVGGSDSRNPSSLDAPELEALRQSSSVEWIDEVPDVRPLISDADVVVLPSYREGLPRSLLEGGAMGRALIATDVPGCREVVRENWNGYLVPPADVDALAQAMERLLQSPAKVELFGANALQLVQERFDERTVIRETLEAYAALIRRKAARTGGESELPTVDRSTQSRG